MTSPRFRCALVTGGAGFLGSFLCEELLRRGYEVIAVDNLFRGREENVRHLGQTGRFVFHRMDLMDGADVRRMREVMVAAGVDIVFHYAAVNGTRYFYDRPWEVLLTNAGVTANLVRELGKVPTLRKLVYASSSEVYGSPGKIPTDEDQPIMLRAYSDRDSYAAGKAIGEFYVRLFAREHALPFLVLRIFNTYGERMDTSEYGQVIPEFIRKMLTQDRFEVIGDGTQTRSFCYVEDNVRLSVSAAEMVDEEILNVGSQDEVTIAGLARLLHDIAGRPFAPVFSANREHDHPRRCPSISKLVRLVGDQPGVGLKEGLARVLKHYEHKLGLGR
ncbi:MAG: SDR family NAD(P)-dependent oxidoreductase [Chloroflexota bacterium]